MAGSKPDHGASAISKLLILLTRAVPSHSHRLPTAGTKAGTSVLESRGSQKAAHNTRSPASRLGLGWQVRHPSPYSRDLKMGQRIDPTE